MRNFFYLTLLIFLTTIGSPALAQNPPNNKWFFECKTDPMTDIEDCYMAFMLIDLDFPLLIHLTAIDALFKNEKGNNSGYLLSFIQPDFGCNKVEIRVDTNKKEDLKCITPTTVDNDIFRQMKEGETLLIRFQNKLGKTKVQKISLIGFSENFNKLASTIKDMPDEDTAE